MRSGVGTHSFEAAVAHSGLVSEDSGAAHCATDQGCITCGDVALPLEVVEVDSDRGLALCRDQRGRRETVEIALVLPVEPGDLLLVHAATAIGKLATEEAIAPEVAAFPQGEARGDAGPTPAPRTPGREAEDVRDVSGDPRLAASPQGEARGDAVVEGSP
jgi:hydrogenase maturation factor